MSPAPVPERDERTAAFARSLRAARAALKAGRVLVAIDGEAADELRAGLAAERLWLRDRASAGLELLPELVVQPPGEGPPRLLGWSPVEPDERRARRSAP